MSFSLESLDKKFLNTMLILSLPIVLQNLIQSSLSFIDTLIIGQLGAVAIASVGLANQYIFIISVLLFGISGGATIFTAQLWGKKNTEEIKKYLTICLVCSAFVSIVLSLLAVIFPQNIMRIFSNDKEVIALGCRYLRISSISTLMLAISLPYSSILRSLGEVKMPMKISSIAFGVNTLLGYLLVYGYMGFPKLGIQGAAISTLIARLLEMSMLLFAVNKNYSVIRIKMSNFKELTINFILSFLKIASPVILSELVWGLGISAYAVAYASMGTDSIASKNIMNTIEGLTWIIFTGLGNACAIMIGNKIGEKDEGEVVAYTKNFITLGLFLSFIMSLILILISGHIVKLFNVSVIVQGYAVKNLLVMAAFLWIRVLNFICLTGLLRSGGDTKYCLWIDIIGVWGVGVPFAFLAAKVWHLDVYWIYAFASLEEVFKLSAALPRIYSRKWINAVA